MRAEVRLPRRVQRRVAAVAQEQIQLDFVVARPIEQELVVSRGYPASPAQDSLPRGCIASVSHRK